MARDIQLLFFMLYADKKELFVPQDDLGTHNHTQKCKKKATETCKKWLQKLWIQSQRLVSCLLVFTCRRLTDSKRNANRTPAYGPVKPHQLSTAWISEVVQDVTLASQRFNALRGGGDISFRSIRLGEAWAQVRVCAEGCGGGGEWGHLIDKDEQVSSQGD